MSWQDEWRQRARGWIDRLNRLAIEWHQLDLRGVRAARERRRLALKVRDWVYEVVDIYLGGVDALPHQGPLKSKGGIGDLGAVSVPLVVAGAAVTVATLGAWISNEEERVIVAKAKLVRAIGEEARKAQDPEVKKALAGVARRLDPNGSKSGPSLLWLVPLAAVPLVPVVVKRLRGQSVQAA